MQPLDLALEAALIVMQNGESTGGATFRFVERGGWGNAMYHLIV
jgi:hypothetical protein